MAPGRRILFEGELRDVSPQTILTDFLVDHIHPVSPHAQSSVVARSGDRIVGTMRRLGKGMLIYLGYRPRDDQSAHMGYETRNWFEVLRAAGAYPGDDNTEVISRTTDYLACRFPNGATALAPHLTHIEEDWPDGFSRNPQEDAEALARITLPSDRIRLHSFRVNGHLVDYDGRGALAFRTGSDGQLIAFAGHDATEITVDGRRFVFADRPEGLVGWAPVPENRRQGKAAALIVFSETAVQVRIPSAPFPAGLVFFAEGASPASKGQAVPCRRENDSLVLDITEAAASRYIYGLPAGS